MELKIQRKYDECTNYDTAGDTTDRNRNTKPAHGTHRNDTISPTDGNRIRRLHKRKRQTAQRPLTGGVGVRYSDKQIQ